MKRTKRVVTPDQIALLPSKVHQIVARQLIASGEWVCYNPTPTTDQKASRKEVD